MTDREVAFLARRILLSGYTLYFSMQAVEELVALKGCMQHDEPVSSILMGLKRPSFDSFFTSASEYLSD